MTSLRLLCVCLVLSLGCLSRTEIGVESAPLCGTCDDAGAATTDAGPDTREERIRDFIHELAGTWQGTSRIEGIDEALEIAIEFRLDGTYVARCVGMADPDCAPFWVGPATAGTPGRYWITDVTPYEKFWGRTLDPVGDTELEALLDHMTLVGDELRFSRRLAVWGYAWPPTLVSLRRAQ